MGDHRITRSMARAMANNAPSTTASPESHWNFESGSCRSEEISRTTSLQTISSERRVAEKIPFDILILIFKKVCENLQRPDAPYINRFDTWEILPGDTEQYEGGDGPLVGPYPNFHRNFDPEKRVWVDRSHHGPPNWPADEEGLYDDVFSPSVFPRALAWVSPLWRDAMSHIPALWTRLLISVGKYPTPLSMIEPHLALSGDLPLDIVISHRPNDDTNRRSENACVAAVMNLLKPHASRWRTLYINVVYASSIPLMSAEVIANQLIDLRMECQEIDMTARQPRRKKDKDMFVAPLKALTLCGPTFRYAFLYTSSSLASITRLTISGHNSQNPSKFTACDLLLCVAPIPKLKELQLLDINLQPSPRYADSTIVTGRWGLHELHITDMSRAAFAELNGIIFNAKLVSLTRVEGESWVVTGGVSLYLSEIDSHADMFAFLEHWGTSLASTLDVRDCAGFTDDIVSRLSTSTHGPEPWMCPKLAILRIEGCPGVSSGALRKMAEVRRMAHEKHGYWYNSNPKHVVMLSRLVVVGCGVLDPKDRVWFDAHLPNIQWDSWKGGIKSRE